MGASENYEPVIMVDRRRDERHVAKCLAQGGFARAFVLTDQGRNARTVYLGPDGQAWRHIPNGRPPKPPPEPSEPVPLRIARKVIVRPEGPVQEMMPSGRKLDGVHYGHVQLRLLCLLAATPGGARVVDVLPLVQARSALELNGAFARLAKVGAVRMRGIMRGSGGAKVWCVTERGVKAVFLAGLEPHATPLTKIIADDLRPDGLGVTGKARDDLIVEAARNGVETSTIAATLRLTLPAAIRHLHRLVKDGRLIHSGTRHCYVWTAAPGASV